MFLLLLYSPPGENPPPMNRMNVFPVNVWEEIEDEPELLLMLWWMLCG